MLQRTFRLCSSRAFRGNVGSRVANCLFQEAPLLPSFTEDLKTMSLSRTNIGIVLPSHSIGASSWRNDPADCRPQMSLGSHRPYNCCTAAAGGMQLTHSMPGGSSPAFATSPVRWQKTLLGKSVSRVRSQGEAPSHGGASEAAPAAEESGNASLSKEEPAQASLDEPAAPEKAAKKRGGAKPRTARAAKSITEDSAALVTKDPGVLVTEEQSLSSPKPKPRKTVSPKAKPSGSSKSKSKALPGDEHAEADWRCGGIHIILGPMFSGKTTELLKRVASERAQGRNVLLVKSHVDTRYAEKEVVAHSGQSMECLAITSMADIPLLLGQAAYEKVDVIAVDEAQFIQDVDFFATNAADHLRKTIIVAGLDGDFMRRKFGGLVDLIPQADTVTKLQSRCQICGDAAMFTLRKCADMRRELVGGSDVYMPVCRKHYIAAKSLVDSLGAASEAAKPQDVENASTPNT